MKGGSNPKKPMPIFSFWGSVWVFMGFFGFIGFLMGFFFGFFGF
jgi:hypothetical protein